MPSDKPSLGCIALTDITGTTATGHSNVQPASSGSFAIFTAIRRASSLVSKLAAESSAASLVQSLIWTDAGLFGAAGAGASSAGLSLGSGLADEARRCGLTAVSTAGL